MPAFPRSLLVWSRVSGARVGIMRVLAVFVSVLCFRSFTAVAPYVPISIGSVNTLNIFSGPYGNYSAAFEYELEERTVQHRELTHDLAIETKSVLENKLLILQNTISLMNSSLIQLIASSAAEPKKDIINRMNISQEAELKQYPADCYEILLSGHNISGVYKIKPAESQPFSVFCDQDTDEGGWTVFQNRFDNKLDFFKEWEPYKTGFGDVAGQYWLGLENMYLLTKQKAYKLRVNLEAPDGETAFANYDAFAVSPEVDYYSLSTLGIYDGTAGDSLSYHSGHRFSTKDKSLDGSYFCATLRTGAWWYNYCSESNLNGQYISGLDDSGEYHGITWSSFKGNQVSMKKTRMMIKPSLKTVNNV